ncbi:hypothetical protein V6N13_120171 [Hibiscus sabdariffa]
MRLPFSVALVCATVSLFAIAGAEDPYRFFNWNVTYGDIFPLGVRQTGILINGQFPGPDIHSVTNDNLIINVFNNLDVPFLLSWILSRPRIPVPFPDPDGDYTVLIGDWYKSNHTALKAQLDGGNKLPFPDGILINGRGPGGASFNVEQGKTYRLRISNNNEDIIQSWHLDGYNFFLVGMDGGQWTPASRNGYNLRDAVSRCTTQVYPKSWTAIYVALDNVGMWNLRSENWARRYLGQQFYLRVFTTSTSLRDEYPIPKNALLCGRASGRRTRPI